MARPKLFYDWNTPPSEVYWCLADGENFELGETVEFGDSELVADGVVVVFRENKWTYGGGALWGIRRASELRDVKP